MSPISKIQQNKTYLTIAFSRSLVTVRAEPPLHVTLTWPTDLITPPVLRTLFHRVLTVLTKVQVGASAGVTGGGGGQLLGSVRVAETVRTVLANTEVAGGCTLFSIMTCIQMQKENR